MTAVPENLKTGLSKLLKPGLLGYYDWFEVIEISCLSKGKYLNVFTIYVAVETLPTDPHKDRRFLNERHKRNVAGIKGAKFGIARRYVKAQRLLDAMDKFTESKNFETHNDSLICGELSLTPSAFYPPDGTETIPLNRVLKNNFWNGSHVIEFADAEKSNLQFLITAMDNLAALGTWVMDIISIDIASVSDRLGNIIIQLPVSSIAVRFESVHKDYTGIRIAWAPTVEPRRITGTVQQSHDGAVLTYGQQDLDVGVNPVAFCSPGRSFKGLVWDAQNRTILAAYPSTYFLRAGAIQWTTSTGGHLHRVFYEEGDAGLLERSEIALSEVTSRPNAQSRPALSNGGWTERRISNAQIRELLLRKEFVQYSGPNSDASGHKLAIQDIRSLINKYGEDAVYLWDPYLSAKDLLKTMFHCRHIGSDLRALTSSNVCERSDDTASKGKEKREEWMKDQKQLLDGSIEGNGHLKLEFRISFGPRGWHFHDRFLLFPGKGFNAPKVWSLGASVNKFGSTHAILQKVAHPQPVLEAFEELWNKLVTPEHLVWLMTQNKAG